MSLHAALVLSERALHHDENPVTRRANFISDLHVHARPTVFHRGHGENFMSLVADESIVITHRFTQEVVEMIHCDGRKESVSNVISSQSNSRTVA